MALALLVFCATPAKPAAALAIGNNTATITVQGMARPICSVSVNVNSQAASIDLSTSQSDYAVATVAESCTSRNGYRVSVASQNAAAGNGSAALLGVSSGDALRYTLLYNGTPASFSNGTAVVTDSSGKAIDVPKSVAIAFAADPAAAADTYQDVLTFSIVSK